MLAEHQNTGLRFLTEYTYGWMSVSMLQKKC